MDATELCALLATHAILQLPRMSSTALIGQLECVLAEVRTLACRCGHLRVEHMHELEHTLTGETELSEECIACAEAGHHCAGYLPPNPFQS